jgi:hypothetical protein
MNDKLERIWEEAVVANRATNLEFAWSYWKPRKSQSRYQMPWPRFEPITTRMRFSCVTTTSARSVLLVWYGNIYEYMQCVRRKFSQISDGYSLDRSERKMLYQRGSNSQPLPRYCWAKKINDWVNRFYLVIYNFTVNATYLLWIFWTCFNHKGSSSGATTYIYNY